jgi:sec-independent protein translocase protein TatC
VENAAPNGGPGRDDDTGRSMTPDPTQPGSVIAPSDEFAEEAPLAESDRSRMTFLEHLDELRRRLLYSAYAIFASWIVTFYFWREMFEYMVRYFSAFGGSLMYNQPMAGFTFSLKITLLAGVLLASPFVFSQVWLFVAPGLYAKEKRVVLPFVFFSSLLFGGGAWFAHKIAFPSMWTFFAGYEIAGLNFMPALDITFAFYVKMILGLGLVFQMPMLVFFLARFGVVTAGFLARKFKYALLTIFILAALITPSADPVNQLIFAAPMIVLYGISIGVAWIFGKKKKDLATT